MNIRFDIGTVPDDINSCHRTMPQRPGHDPSSEDLHGQFIQKLRRKFFPLKNKRPPPFFENIFVLVANTCIAPTCKMDKVIELVDSALSVARCANSDDDHDHLSKPMASKVSKVWTKGRGISDTFVF